MKIGIDLRFLGTIPHQDFYILLIENTILLDTKNTYTIYVNKTDKKFSQNINTKIVDIPLGSFAEQIQYSRYLQKENLDLCIFFDHFKPLWYKGDYYCFVTSLKDVYYSNFSNLFEKHLHFFTIDRSIKSAQKVICFDATSRQEIIEKYNIGENKIHLLPGFFSTSIQNDFPYSRLDIKTKYTLASQYIIYPGGNGIEQNYEKLIYVIEKLHKNNTPLDLVFLGDSITREVGLRQIVLEKKLEKHIHFLGSLSSGETELLYKNSAGVILPSYYEPFPFCLDTAVSYNTPIISSKLPSIQDVFKDEITYFSPLSVNNMYQNLAHFISGTHFGTDYTKIHAQYSCKQTCESLIKIIN